jgi:hypothetical protein
MARHIIEHMEEKAHCPYIDWDFMAIMLLTSDDALEYKELTIHFYKTFTIHYKNALGDHKKAFVEGRINDFRNTAQLLMDEYRIHCHQVFMELYEGR